MVDILAAQSKAWVYGYSLAGVAGSNPTGEWIFVSCECCVLSDGDLATGRSLVHRSSTEFVSQCDRGIS
jgi:hypothetical protein